jgi:hypothetical protein
VLHLTDVTLDWCYTWLVLHLTGVTIDWCYTWLVLQLTGVTLDWYYTRLVLHWLVWHWGRGVEWRVKEVHAHDSFVGIGSCPPPPQHTSHTIATNLYPIWEVPPRSSFPLSPKKEYIEGNTGPIPGSFSSFPATLANVTYWLAKPRPLYVFPMSKIWVWNLGENLSENLHGWKMEDNKMDPGFYL